MQRCGTPPAPTPVRRPAPPKPKVKKSETAVEGAEELEEEEEEVEMIEEIVEEGELILPPQPQRHRSSLSCMYQSIIRWCNLPALFLALHTAPSPCCSVLSPADWWEALVTIPKDAATLNFVFFYYEHCDNNERRDFKVTTVRHTSVLLLLSAAQLVCDSADAWCGMCLARWVLLLSLQALVDVPSSFKTMEAWADSLLPAVSLESRACPMSGYSSCFWSALPGSCMLVVLPPTCNVPHHLQFKEAITTKRLAEEAEQERVEAERKASRRKAQAKAEAVRRKQMKHVLFAVPEVPQVGPGRHQLSTLALLSAPTSSGTARMARPNTSVPTQLHTC